MEVLLQQNTHPDNAAQKAFDQLIAIKRRIN
jgi:hypothetical protein